MSTLHRLDQSLVARGFVSSRTRAADLIRNGKVQVAGHVISKPAAQVGPDEHIHVSDIDPMVSRAGHKLEGFLADLGTGVPDIQAKRCLDIGASTGGFTQVLLAHGAQHVVALDVGHDQLAASLRSDPRVTLMEGCNARFLDDGTLPWRPDLIVADVSFISLTMLLEPMRSVLDPGKRALVLVKPQFEVGREALGSGGVVRDPLLREQAVTNVVDAGLAAGLQPRTVRASRLPGPHGNVEYFVDFEARTRREGPESISATLSNEISHAVRNDHTEEKVS
ncbi:23S rRNA (cytidine1920-2'-O)/16S rRNA (cytidine1409-2'-O)-methyltransferase [Micrococcales bacterium KH10]|nr:23S rRNA (cytidine1920-2'-O)/16S rRNA (cytidine1409-2'-O)-methyltransferase [Micrococcales bacterium KH10]